MSCLAVAIFKPKCLCVSDPGVANLQILAKRAHPPCNATARGCKCSQPRLRNDENVTVGGFNNVFGDAPD